MRIHGTLLRAIQAAYYKSQHLLNVVSSQFRPWQLPHAAAVDDRAMEPDCRPDLKSNGTSETSAPQLLRRDRSPNGRLSGPDRAPAGASAGFTDKNGEPQRRRTTALMARPPHGGHAHRDAAAKPPCAAKRTQAHIAPAATAAPAESPALGGPECPQGEIGPRARTSSARPTRDPPAARPRSAGPARTGLSRARPKKIDPT